MQEHHPQTNTGELVLGIVAWAVATFLFRAIFVAVMDIERTGQLLVPLTIYIAFSALAIYFTRKNLMISVSNGITVYTVLIVIGSTVLRAGCSPAFMPVPLSLCLPC